MQELLTYPTFFFISWFGKVLPAVIIASFVYLCHRRQWWTIVLSVVIDLWIISNLFYFKANGLYLTYEAMTMVGNLHGFEDSLLTLLDWTAWMVLAITVAYIVVFFALRLRKYQMRSTKWFLGWTLSFLLLDCASNAAFWYHAFWEEKPSLGQRISNAYPFGLVHNDAVSHSNCSDYRTDYMYCQSVLSYLPAMFLHDYWTSKRTSLSEEDCQYIARYWNGWREIRPVNNLVFILVESLESWPLEKINGIDFMPFLSQIKQSGHVFYADRLKCQIKYGMSGDGQMISMTGMLPIDNGVACFRYGSNRYPNFASSYASSAIFNPCKGTWNQSVVTPSYGFNHLFESEDVQWGTDATVFQRTTDYVLSDLETPFCVLALTISSHMPFNASLAQPYPQDPEMPALMSRYLNSLSYTDSCLQACVTRILNSPPADSTVIVITGDHTIFRSNSYDDLDRYASAKGIPFKANHNYVPLIIYSPDIERNEYLHEEVYQMDIFPTVCAMLDSTVHNPSFGVNLRDSVARQHRPISEEEAYRMSDLIIRSNYFGLQK
ncbi:MAG: LTA synthase family protein [Bacteroidales bacterium]|nr:LTA synthase family protein [Bacteroidales bacterium]